MREVLSYLLDRWRRDVPVGMATVVATFHSVPRSPGASMLVEHSGEVTGSVSGGCVEGAVYDVAQDVLRTGRSQLHRYGISDDDAFSVGLTCGGLLDVYVERVDHATYPQLADVAEDIQNAKPVAVATVVQDASNSVRLGRRMIIRPADSDRPYSDSLGSARVDQTVIEDGRGLLASGVSQTLTYGPDGQRRGEGLRVFVQSFAPPPRLLVFGAIDFAAAVAEQGKLLGYDVTVCDARPTFATAARFPRADRVVVDWPHRYAEKEAAAGHIDEQTVICVLTHDPKFDVPLIEVVLRLPAVAYVGAMGSRRTHEDRTRRLRDVGITDEELSRLSSPIGLDLGARTPQETAVSIMAEVIARRWRGSGQPLSVTQGPIHTVIDHTSTPAIAAVGNGDRDF